MTERLYYRDAYLREFSARVMETADDGRRVYLDRTAFYPTSGGQMFDTGILGGARVIDVIDEQERIAHVLDKPVAEGELSGSIDWARRWDNMQQHSGQHLLSAVLEEQFHLKTVSCHLGTEVSTIDVTAEALGEERMELVEQRCAEIVASAKPMTISFEDPSNDLGLRKPSERQGRLRIITIDGIDKSACGGTHVRNTAEIGAILIRKAEKVRGQVRLEFVCGDRALRRAKEDFRILAALSRQLSVPFEKMPDTLAGQMERLKFSEKQALKLSIELAQREGKEQWTGAAADSDGIRRQREQGPIDDAARTRAQAFVSQGKAVFLAISETPRAVLLAASPDSGVNAGERMKAAMTTHKGRGGGNAGLAQGSLPGDARMDKIADELMA